LPDGSATPAHSYGTEGSMGSVAGYDNPPPCKDARLVNFGADYMMTDRHYSREFVEAIGQAVHERTGWDIPMIGAMKIWLTKTNHDIDGAYFELGYDLNGPAEQYRRIQWATSAYPAITAENIEAGIVEVFGQPFAFAEPEASEPEPIPAPVVVVASAVPVIVAESKSSPKFKPAANGKHIGGKFGGGK